MIRSKTSKRKVAVFDVDGTIFRSSLLLELIEALIAEGVFPESARKMYEKERTDWSNRKGSYDDYMTAFVETFLKHIKRVEYGVFADVAKTLAEKERHRVYRYTRDLVRELRGKGYYLLAISQSPKTVLESFCKGLGFNKVYGRMYEIGPDDRFTGVVTDVHLIENKANILRRAVEKEGLTLAGSIGVGDTEGDIPLLDMVERPICFNPNARLYRYAKRMGWDVIVERKDVIYHIKD